MSDGESLNVLEVENTTVDPSDHNDTSAIEDTAPIDTTPTVESGDEDSQDLQKTIEEIEDTSKQVQDDDDKKEEALKDEKKDDYKEDLNEDEKDDKDEEEDDVTSKVDEKEEEDDEIATVALATSLVQSNEDEEEIIVEESTLPDEEEGDEVNAEEFSSRALQDSIISTDFSSLSDEEEILTVDPNSPTPVFIESPLYQYYNWRRYFIEAGDKFFGYFLNYQLNTDTSWRHVLIEVDLDAVEVVNPYITFAIGTSLIDVPIDEGTTTIVEVDCLRNVGYCKKYSSLLDANDETFWSTPFELDKTYAVFDNLKNSLNTANPPEIGVHSIDFSFIRGLPGYVNEDEINGNAITNLDLVPIRIWLNTEVGGGINGL